MSTARHTSVAGKGDLSAGAAAHNVVFPDAMRQLHCPGMTVYDARLAVPSVDFKHKKQGSLSKGGGAIPPAFVEAEAMCVAAYSRPGFWA